MRFPEAKIKEAILHPEKLARQEAVNYFSNCFSRDTDVMPLAIQAVENFGRRQAFSHVHVMASLAQTEATVEWAIRELHKEENKVEDHDSYLPALSRLLCNADPRLLVPRAQEILQAPGFLKDLTFAFQERLDLLAWDADRCWKEVEDICQEAVKPEMADVDFGHADRVVEALARQGDKYTEKVLELLGHRRLQGPHRRWPAADLPGPSLVLLPPVLEVRGAGTTGADDSVHEEPLHDGSHAFHHGERFGTDERGLALVEASDGPR